MMRPDLHVLETPKGNELHVEKHEEVISAFAVDSHGRRMGLGIETVHAFHIYEVASQVAERASLDAGEQLANIIPHGSPEALETHPGFGPLVGEWKRTHAFAVHAREVAERNLCDVLNMVDDTVLHSERGAREWLAAKPSDQKPA